MGSVLRWLGNNLFFMIGITVPPFLIALLFPAYFFPVSAFIFGPIGHLFDRWRRDQRESVDWREASRRFRDETDDPGSTSPDLPD